MPPQNQLFDDPTGQRRYQRLSQQQNPYGQGTAQQGTAQAPGGTAQPRTQPPALQQALAQPPQNGFRDTLFGFNRQDPAQQSATPRTPSAPTNQWATSALSDAYQQYLGRTPGPGEVESWLQQPNFNLESVIAQIQQSPEAKTFASQPPHQASPQPQAPQQGNTKGYAQPGFTAPDFGPAPAGWDPQKWADQQHQTPKYVWGRIYASHPNTPEGRAAMIADLQKAYPGTTFDGKDKANVPGIGVIDLFGNASGGQFAPSWQDLTAEAAQPQPFNMGALPPPTTFQPPSTGAPNVDASVPAPTAPAVPPAVIPPAPTDQSPDQNPATYDPGALPAFVNPITPEMQALQAQQLEVLQGLLQNPAYGPQQIGALKEQQKEGLLAFQQQNEDRFLQDLANRGVSQGGQRDAFLRRSGDALSSDLTKSYRDIELQAAAQNQNSLAQALGLTSSTIGGQIGQDLSAQQAALAQALAGEGLSQASAGSYGQAAALALQQALGQGQLGVQQGQLGLDAQKLQQLADQFGKQLGFDYAQLGQQGNQFGQQLGLDYAQLGQQGNQFNTGMGFNYAQLQANQQNALINSILAALGG